MIIQYRVRGGKRQIWQRKHDIAKRKRKKPKSIVAIAKLLEAALEAAV